MDLSLLLTGRTIENTTVCNFTFHWSLAGKVKGEVTPGRRKGGGGGGRHLLGRIYFFYINCREEIRTMTTLFVKMPFKLSPSEGGKKQPSHALINLPQSHNWYPVI